MVFAVGTASAITIKIYPKFKSVNNGNISWSLTGKKFTVSPNGSSEYKGGNNTYEIFSFPEGTLNANSTININIGDTRARILFYYSDNSSYTWQGFNTTGIKTKTLSEINSGLAEKASTITSIRIGGPAQGSAVISEDIILEEDPDKLYLLVPQEEGMQITTQINNCFEWYSYSTNEVYGHTNSQLSKNLGNSLTGDNKTIFGPYSGNAKTAYMNIEGYDNALVTLSVAGVPGIRFMYGESPTTLTLDTDADNKYYTQDFSTLDKIGIIKTQNGNGSNSFTVADIVFNKSFLSSSTTDFKIAASSSSTVNYDRTFTTGTKATVCLPFDLNEAQVTETGGKFYEFIGATASTLQFQEVSSTKAYTPYIFVAGSTTNPFASLTNIPVKASAGATTTVEHNGFIFTGTLAKTDVESGSYGIHGDAFVQAGTGVTIKAFRAYFTGGFSSAHEMSIDWGGDVTGIKNITPALKQAEGARYNLQGQRVSEGHKGLVIKNGRKYVVK